MTKARHIAVMLVVSGVLSLTLASSASATWGNKCSAGATHHCYAISEWKMSGNGHGGGEEVMGLSSEFYTTAMLVPNWQKANFVSNEQWMVNPSGGWMEDGEIAGIQSDAASLHWFFAYDVNNVLSEYYSPSTVEGYQWHSYTVEDPERNGLWCARIGQEQIGCVGTFAPYSADVQVGMEAGDEQQPENAGKDRTGVEYTYGGWYHWGAATKNFTRAYAGASENYYMCAANYEAIPGYIQWGTPLGSYPC